MQNSTIHTDAARRPAMEQCSDQHSQNRRGLREEDFTINTTATCGKNTDHDVTTIQILAHPAGLLSKKSQHCKKVDNSWSHPVSTNT